MKTSIETFGERVREKERPRDREREIERRRKSGREKKCIVEFTVLC